MRGWDESFKETTIKILGLWRSSHKGDWNLKTIEWVAYLHV